MTDALQPQERRRHPRVPLDIHLFYRTIHPPEFQMGAPDEPKRTGAVDLSEGGIGFDSDQEFLPFTELEITFHLMFHETENPTISAIAQVRYCRAMPQAQGDVRYRVGASFTKVDDTDKRLIAEYVRIFTSQKPAE